VSVPRGTPDDEALEAAPAATGVVELGDLGETLFPNLPRFPDGDDGTPYAKDVDVRVVRQRLRAQVLLTLRAQGFSVPETARMVGMTPTAVKKALTRARAAGRLNDLRGILRNDSLARAVDGLNHHLDKKDKDAIFKTLDAVGGEVGWQAGRQAPSVTGGAQLPPLQLTIVNQLGATVAPAVTAGGPIGGAPCAPGTVLVGTARVDEETP
jgi:predicted transcriptional regulator